MSLARFVIPVASTIVKLHMAKKSEEVVDGSTKGLGTQTLVASGVQPSTVARNDAWVVSPSSAARPVMSEQSSSMFGAAMRTLRSVIWAPMEPGMPNPAHEAVRQLDAARESLRT